MNWPMTIMCSMRRTCRQTKTLWNWGEECYLIGVIDDFYMIMDTDENVRYIPQDWLWAGNG